MEDRFEELALFAVILICILLGSLIGYGCGQYVLADKIATGTHKVEVLEFTDGTREVRIVETTNE